MIGKRDTKREIVRLGISVFLTVARANVCKGAFLVKDDSVLKGPLGRSLRSFARTAHSAYLLRNALLAPLTGLLTLVSLSWDSEIHKNVFTL